MPATIADYPTDKQRRIVDEALSRTTEILRRPIVPDTYRPRVRIPMRKLMPGVLHYDEVDISKVRVPRDNNPKIDRILAEIKELEKQHEP